MLFFSAFFCGHLTWFVKCSILYLSLYTKKKEKAFSPICFLFPIYFTAANANCMNKTMIRLKSLNCKLKNILSSITSLFQRCLDQSCLGQEMCPFCGTIGQCRMHGSYQRNLIHFLDGHAQVLKLTIPRVLCSCGHSHALLADFIVPYLSYSLPMIFMILADYFSNRIPISKICDKYDISVPVLYRLKKVFLIHKKEWLGILEDLETQAAAFLEGLLNSQVFSGFSFLFLKQTTHSFMQSHKNPANCLRPHFPDTEILALVHNL